MRAHHGGDDGHLSEKRLELFADRASAALVQRQRVFPYFVFRHVPHVPVCLLLSVVVFVSNPVRGHVRTVLSPYGCVRVGVQCGVCVSNPILAVLSLCDVAAAE